jgi:hypothetical protein
MMKKLLLSFLAIAMTICATNAQTAEAFIPLETNGSQITNQNNNSSSLALFDFLYRIDVGANGAIGADGQAGVIFINNQYWISTWAANTIHVLDATGAFVETFSITGVTGTRSMTTDGTNVYIGTAAASIQVINPITRVRTATIAITTTSGATARMLTYDGTLNGGAGGFWIGNFGSAIASVSMTGAELSVIPAATHGTIIYGGAVDTVSTGGPYLWIHDQTALGARDVITQVSIATGAPTGVQYDYATEANSTATGFLSGGLFISDQVVPDTTALIGLCQCTPSNEVFAIELRTSLSVQENELANFSLYPNPANSGIVTIKTKVSGEKQVSIVDVLGRTVLEVKVLNDEINISSLNSGVYLVRIQKGNSIATKKLVIR